MEQKEEVVEYGGGKVGMFFNNVVLLIAFGAMLIQGFEWIRSGDKFEAWYQMVHAVIFFMYLGLVIWVVSIRPEDRLKKFLLRIWNGLLR